MNTPTVNRGAKPTAAQRFAKYVRIGDVPSHAPHLGPCLVWVGVRKGDGYGLFSNGGRKVLAHRFAWEQVHGPVPDGLTLDHLCQVRNCVQVVGHLEPVSSAVNTLRGLGPTALNARKTDCPRCGGPYDLVEKNGCRRCRSCTSEYQREYYRSRRA